MWKRSGQSAALDRAQALLSAQRNRRGVGQSTQGSPAKIQHTVGVSGKNRSTAPTTHTVFSDLSDLSSVSSAPEHRADTMDSVALEKDQGRDGVKDLRPQSSLGGGSRFLKKAPLPPTNSSQSPVSNSKIQHISEPRYVSSSQRGSQTAALNRLAQIESRFLSRKQPQETTRQGPKPAHNLTSDLGTSPPPEAVSQNLEASVPVSAQTSSDQSQKGKRFLKTKATVAVGNTNTAASRSPKAPDAGVRSWSRAASAAVPVVGMETKSVRATSNVNLESDEEDMRKLLGDSLDSTDNTFLRPKKISVKKANKMLSKTSQMVPSTHCPVSVQPRSSSTIPPPRSPASPHRSSPFRFTGQPQAHFSPSVLSPSPSPPCVSPSLSGRLNSPHRAGSPQRSLSTTGHSEVLSLEELFPVEHASEDLHSAMSVVSSEDFKINVMTLDDLVPATLGFTEKTPGKEREERSPPVLGSPNTHPELPRYKEKEQQQEEEEEDILDYQSDFESESRTEPNYSASQVSEHLPGDGNEEEVVSEVRDETLDVDMSHERKEDDYSSRRSCMSWTSNYSETSKSPSRSRDSRSSVSHSSQTSSYRSGRRAAARRVLKEAAVQTQPDTMTHTWLTGMATSGPALGLTYINSIPAAAHTLGAETVEALSNHNTAVFVLNEMLKQQLAMTKWFIESSRHLHSSLVRSLEPPNYRYTKLEDTKEYIRKHRTPKLTVEEALKEVMQEMREYNL